MTVKIKQSPPSSLPEWDVDRWLKIRFYKDKCVHHPSQYKTVYCSTCKQEPVCPICWRNISDQHHGDRHQVLTVWTASRRAAICENEIRKFMDVSEIQIYTINRKPVVYLNPDQSRPSSHCQPNCCICRRGLMKKDESLKYKFCSIACKIQKWKQVDDPMKIAEKKSDDSKKTTTIKFVVGKRKMMSISDDIEANCVIKRKIMKISEECCPVSFRKRSRKGIPQRAPFF